MDCETISLVLIVVGTIALVIMMSGSWYSDDYNHYNHDSSSICYMVDGLKNKKQEALNNNGKHSNEYFHSGNMDHSSAIQKMALEPDVQKSHSEWLGEFAARTTTASTESVRDDPNNIVTPMGLAAMMRQSCQYHTRAQPLEDSRVIPSDIPNEIGGPGPSMSFYCKNDK